MRDPTLAQEQEFIDQLLHNRGLDPNKNPHHLTIGFSHDIEKIDEFNKIAIDFDISQFTLGALEVRMHHINSRQYE